MEVCTGSKYTQIHHDIVHEDSTCPLCDALGEIRKLTKERDDLQERIDKLGEEE